MSGHDQEKMARLALLHSRAYARAATLLLEGASSRDEEGARAASAEALRAATMSEAYAEIAREHRKRADAEFTKSQELGGGGKRM